MATLQTQDGRTISVLSDIQQALSPLNVHLRYWPTAPLVQPLLDKASLSAEEKEAVAAAHDHYFVQLQNEESYQHRDLIVLHPDIPQLPTLLQTFATIHTHDDDEVRYIVEGEGIFGFVLPDESQLLLTITAGAYINVPKNTEHWFILTPQQRIKALRYFTSTDGWTPRYTGRAIRI